MLLSPKNGRAEERTQIGCAVSTHLSPLTPRSLATRGMKQTVWVAHLTLDSLAASCKPQIVCLWQCCLGSGYADLN